jgi:hypothetical protein
MSTISQRTAQFGVGVRYEDLPREKFSLPYCLASLLVRGSVDIDSCMAEAIVERDVLELAARVDYEQRTYAAAPDAFPGGVRVRTRDGRVLEAEPRRQRGGADNPMATAKVVDKFRVNARQALPGIALATLESAILGLESQPTLAPVAILGGPARVRTARGRRVRQRRRPLPLGGTSSAGHLTEVEAELTGGRSAIVVALEQSPRARQPLDLVGALAQDQQWRIALEAFDEVSLATGNPRPRGSPRRSAIRTRRRWPAATRRRRAARSTHGPLLASRPWTHRWLTFV